MKSNLFNLSILFFSLILVTFGCLSIYYPLLLGLPFNIVIPACVALLFYQEGFASIKLFTIAFGRTLLLLTILGLFHADWFNIFIILALQINILEAVIYDVMNKHFFNVFAGLAIFAGALFIKASFHQLYFTTSAYGLIIWVIAYTLWNFNFVTLNFSAKISLFHIAILLSPLIVVLLTHNAGLWQVIRGATLAQAGTLQLLAISNPHWLSFINEMNYSQYAQTLKNHSMQCLLLLLILILMSVFVLLNLHSW